MKRIERLTAMITFLQSRKYSTINRLQEKFNVSDRTIYRDIASLNKIPVPVVYEPNKGYSILDRHFVPPISFIADEAIALVLAGALMKRFSDDKTNYHFENALEKVKYALNANQINILEAIEENTKIRVYKDHSRQENYLFTVQHAISGCRILKIKYRNRRGEISVREIEPIGITFYGNEWHTVAYCWKRKEYRDFIISSMLELNDTKRPFKKEIHISFDEYLRELEKKDASP
jgi:predicted DNA-binding transcriptional regulator YafY